jgi:hypothetical protein
MRKGSWRSRTKGKSCDKLPTGPINGLGVARVCCKLRWFRTAGIRPANGAGESPVIGAYCPTNGHRRNSPFRPILPKNSPLVQKRFFSFRSIVELPDSKRSRPTGCKYQYIEPPAIVGSCLSSAEFRALCRIASGLLLGHIVPHALYGNLEGASLA